MRIWSFLLGLGHWCGHQRWLEHALVLHRACLRGQVVPIGIICFGTARAKCAENNIMKKSHIFYVFVLLPCMEDYRCYALTAGHSAQSGPFWPIRKSQAPKRLFGLALFAADKSICNLCVLCRCFGILRLVRPFALGTAVSQRWLIDWLRLFTLWTYQRKNLFFLGCQRGFELREGLFNHRFSLTLTNSLCGTLFKIKKKTLLGILDLTAAKRACVCVQTVCSCTGGLRFSRSA